MGVAEDLKHCRLWSWKGQFDASKVFKKAENIDLPEKNQFSHN